MLPVFVRPALFVAAWGLFGCDVVLRALGNIRRGEVFDENFLMSIATAGAFALGEYPEAAAIMLFYQIGEAAQNRAVARSKQSIADLMDIRPDYATLVRPSDGVLERVSPESVRVNDTIFIKPGEKVPLDGVVIAGESMLDTRALTGESVPRRATVGGHVLSGCVNQTGALRVRVEKTAGNSTAAKVLALVENAASRKAPTEHVITTYSR
jgi:Cd2+/Zn2+-exporting ATPase